MADFVTCRHCGEMLFVKDPARPPRQCPVCGSSLASPAPPAEPVAPTTRKVLIVEDEPATLTALTARLKLSGYQVVAATDGVAAIAMTRRERPDVIILDLGLPGGDGFQVMERLHHINPTRLTPIVVVTASDPATHEARARAAGARAFLQKPIRAQALLDALEAAVNT